MMKREGLVERGIRIALTLGMLLMVSAGGMRGAGHGSVTGENAGDAGHGLAAGGNEENAGSGSGAEKSTGMTDVSEMAGAALSTDDLGKETARAALTQDEPEAGLQGNVLTYGGLCVAFPEGIEPERIDAQDNGNIFDNGRFLSDGSKGRILDLCGAQEVYADRVGGDGIEVYLALPPRVRLMHYRAVYESETALLCALFDLLPEAVGHRMYADEEKREYTYRLEQDGYLYFFLVQGDAVCLVQEIAIEERCSFGELLADGMVHWKDGGSVGYWKEPDAFSYRRLAPEEGISFLYACERRRGNTKLRLYREGYYERPFQEIPGDLGSGSEGWIQIKDVNFDGCPDLAGYRETYLWNRQTKVYEPAQCELSLLYEKGFPETETIWSITNNDIPAEWGPVSAAEAIWQWEGNALVKKRECVVSIVEDGLKVWAYEDAPKQLLFEETFSLDAWEREEQGRVRLLYERFYDGMAPKEVYARMHRMEGERKRIPQALLDETASMMAAGKDPVLLSEVGDGEESAVLGTADGKYAGGLCTTGSGRELTQEEMLSLAGRDMAVRQQVQEAAHYNYMYTFLQADCDNDGAEDLVGRLYGHFIGGTSGNADYIFLKGRPDGFYEETDSFFEVQEEFGILTYEGKQYLCLLDFDYSSLIYEGYTWSCYEDGKRVEEASLHLVPKEYEIRQIWAEAGYESLAQRMTKECAAVKERLDKGREITGKAERTADQEAERSEGNEGDYQCDLDNDGQEESYHKGIRYLANLYARNYLEFTLQKDHVSGWEDGEGKAAYEEADRGLAMFVKEMESSADTPLALWADPYRGKNIVHVLYRTGLDDYRITGCLVEETDYRKVYEIAADAVYQVEQERSVVF